MKLSLLLLALVVLAPSRAVAVEPELRWLDDGTLHIEVDFAAPPARLAELLGDTERVLALSEQVLSVRASPQGSCERVTVTTQGITEPLRYTSLRCVDADGVRDELLSSSDYRAMHTRWILRPIPEGTHAVIETRTVLAFSVPRFLVRAGQKKGMRDLIRSIERELQRR